MRIVAIETSGTAGSLAADDQGTLRQTMLDPALRSARSLAPALDNLLKQLGWNARDLELVAVSVGPGSFTGLRVGVTAAKTLAYLAGATLLGIDTHEAIAAAAPERLPALWTVVDAQRGQASVRGFTWRADGYHPLGPAQLLDAGPWLDQLPPEATLTGPGLRRMPEAGRAQRVDPRFWDPTALAVLQLAQTAFAAGRRDDPWSLVPHYSRPSAAEEKAAASDPPPA